MTNLPVILIACAAIYVLCGWMTTKRPVAVQKADAQAENRESMNSDDKQKTAEFVTDTFPVSRLNPPQVLQMGNAW